MKSRDGMNNFKEREVTNENSTGCTNHMFFKYLIEDFLNDRFFYGNASSSTKYRSLKQK